jgi:anti-anti-sigma factor
MTSSWSQESVAPGRVRIVVQGEIDLADEDPLVDEVDSLVAAGDNVVVELDMASVEFIDSSGIRALLVLRRAYGEQIVLGARSPAVQRVLDIAGLTDVFSGNWDR